MSVVVRLGQGSRNPEYRFALPILSTSTELVPRKVGYSK